MASISDPITGIDDLGAAEIARATPAEREIALALLLTGKIAPPDQAEQVTATFLRFAEQNQLDLSDLWLARRSNRPLASALVVPSAGRTGMLFISPILADELAPVIAALARHACSRQDGERMRLLQALLEPGQQLEASALQAASFSVLANLVYMQRRTGSGGQAMQLDRAMSIHTWSEPNRPLFAEAIAASYEGTQDCPGLLGRRAMDDIIAGHQASGQFEPDCWFALTEGDRPAAVMMLADLPQRNAVELVYLGVSSAYRRKGLARQLLDHALFLTRQKNRQSLLLAVDEINAPAMRLYQSLGFQKTARKTAMIYWLD